LKTDFADVADLSRSRDAGEAVTSRDSLINDLGTYGLIGAGHKETKALFRWPGGAHALGANPRNPRNRW
jgi:hypothetical protein